MNFTLQELQDKLTWYYCSTDKTSIPLTMYEIQSLPVKQLVKLINKEHTILNKPLLNESEYKHLL